MVKAICRRLMFQGRCLLASCKNSARARQHASVAVVVAEVDDDDTQAPKIVLEQHRAQHRPRLQALRSKLHSETPDVLRAVFNKQPAIPSFIKPHPGTKVPDPAVPFDIHALRRTLAEIPDPGLYGGTLTDTHHRHHNYLRISVAERCNLRCTYCMPAQGVPLQPPEQLLTTPELLHIAATFTAAGVTKFRLTGGEPTLRADLVDIVAGLRTQLLSMQYPVQSIGMTTNGIVLSNKLDELHAAGLTSVNISLDTLNPTKFSSLTRRPAAYLQRVWQSIEHAVDIASTDPNFVVKLNCVVMRGTNDAEIADFVRLSTKYSGLQVRFIEYMPFSDNGWNNTNCVPYQELLQSLKKNSGDDVHLTALPPNDPHDTTKWYETTQGGRVGFITSMSQHFCGSCNRLRLTADGQIKVCLFDGSGTVSLRDAVRAGFSETELRKLIYSAVQKKHAVLGGHTDPAHIMKDAANNRPMTLIGG